MQGKWVDAKPKVIKIYLDALTLLKDKQRVHATVMALLGSNSMKTIKAFHELATAAEYNELPELAAKVYLAALKLDNQDERSLKRLGYMSFFSGDWDGVFRYLVNYNYLYGGDYESHFYIAEVWWALRNENKARPYYETALKKIKQISNRTFPVRMTEVRIFQRIGRIAEALKIYPKLLLEKPDDRRLRADFLELLIAQKMTLQARNLLVQLGK